MMFGATMMYFIEITQQCWQIFRESAFYMLMGFFFAGILYVFIRPDSIAKYFGGATLRSVVLASLIGIPIPLCSCGVIPAAAGLRRQGAGKGATLSFLISTPETGVDSIAVTYALMDPLMTVLRPVAAFFTAVTAGAAEMLFDERTPAGNMPSAAPPTCSCSQTPGKSGLNNCCSANVQEFSLMGNIISGLKYAYVEIMRDIGGWFLIGILIAGIISFVVPDRFFVLLSSNRTAAMFMMMGMGIPMYVCASASTPIAAVLIMKGLNPGAAMVFLLVGPATNAATISMVFGLLGKKCLIIYLVTIALCSFVMGFTVDLIYDGFGISAKAALGRAAQILPPSVEIISSIIFALLLAYALAGRFTTNKSTRSCCGIN